MKNIHVLATDKPSRLSDCHNNKLHLDDVRYLKNYLNIYITSDEEIKDGDYYLYLKNNRVYRFVEKHHTKLLALDIQKKIILTTDQDLIKDGVQAIDDEFLEWFVKNPSCEEVEVIPLRKSSGYYNEKEVWHWDFLAYKIIIPSEEVISDYDVMSNIVYGENVGERIKIKAKIISKESLTLANIRCTCMSFEPNCFTGSCRKCGFLPKEESKQELSARLKNSLIQFNVSLDEAFDLPDWKLKTIGFSNRSILELKTLKEEPKPFKNMEKLTKVDWEKFKKNPIPNKKQEPKQETQGYICPHTKKQCDDECCVSAKDCHLEASMGLLSEPKQETLEEAAKNYRDLKLPDDLYDAFIVGAKWQQERMYSEEDMKEAFSMGRTGKTIEDFNIKFKKK